MSEFKSTLETVETTVANFKTQFNEENKQNMLDAIPKINDANAFADSLVKIAESIKNFTLDEKKKIENKVREDVEKAQAILRALKEPSKKEKEEPKSHLLNGAWADAVTDFKEPVKKVEASAPVPAKQTEVKKKPEQTLVPVPGSAAYLEAFRIQDVEECHKFRGFVCYSEKTNRFVCSVNGFIIEGMPTKIYQSNEQPRKFHTHYECQPGLVLQKDLTDTPFYIPKENYSKSKDIRCLTNRMVYSGASKRHTEEKSKYIIGVGSVENVIEDVQASSPIELNLFYDVSGHYFFTALIAKRYETK